MKKLLAAFLCLALNAIAAGSVSQSISRLGSTDTWVITMDWSGDSSNGSVPATSALLRGGGAPDLQGYVFLGATFSTGSPAPTANYDVTITDGNGVDLLEGGAVNLSQTTPTSVAAGVNAVPLTGTLTLNLTGNSVASARGRILLYLQKPGTMGILRSTGSSGGGSGTVTSVFGRTGAVNAGSGDYSASQVTNTPGGNVASSDVQAAINELDTEKQPLDTELTCLAGLGSAADKLAYFTGSGLCALADFSAFARTLLDDANAAAMRSTIGVGTTASTSNVLKGDAAGNSVAATPGTDYVVPAGNVATSTALAANGANCSNANETINGVTAAGAAENCRPTPQIFIGTAAPGSVPGNLPGDLFSDTTNHKWYGCNAASGTAAPACTSETTNGWQLLNASASGIMTATSGTGDPNGVHNCTAPTTSEIQYYIQTDSTPANVLWRCYATNTWALVLESSGSGPVTVTGEYDTSISAPGTAGQGTMKFLDTKLGYAPNGGTTSYTRTDAEMNAKLTTSTQQAGTPLYCAPASASATTYTCTLTPTLTSYTAGMNISLKIDTSCTGSTATTLNIDSLGAKNIYLADGSSNPTSGDCPANRQLLLRYDGTAFRIIGGGAAGGGGGSANQTLTFNFHHGSCDSGGGTVVGANISLESGTASPTCSPAAGVVYRIFADAATTHLRLHFFLPDNYNSSGTTTAAVHFAGNTTANLNIHYQVKTGCLGVGELYTALPTYNTAQDIVAAEGTAVNQIRSGSLASVTMTGCAAGEIFFADYGRINDGTDTSTNGIYDLGISFGIPVTN